ncbi:hypothetical protein [Salinisphaera sp.]|uniref:hypothetical protein n=1 Tax=Salinisphaera sp. TaxID=1914330 RepID=UPI0025F319F5|nr:hypothetical protein [Salinisphaera sp.]
MRQKPARDFIVGRVPVTGQTKRLKCASRHRGTVGRNMRQIRRRPYARALRPVRAWTWLAVLAAAGLSACGASYHGPSEDEVQAAVKASLQRFDEPVKSRMAPQLARMTRSNFADRLHRVRFIDDEQCRPRDEQTAKADSQLTGAIYDCPVSITMRMNRDAISDATGLADTRFEGQLPLVHRDDGWALTEDSIAREMILSHLLHQSGMGKLFQ